MNRAMRRGNPTMTRTAAPSGRIRVRLAVMQQRQAYPADRVGEYGDFGSRGWQARDDKGRFAHAPELGPSGTSTRKGGAA